jgi:nucleotide-binding universal stress UspA family protein
MEKYKKMLVPLDGSELAEVIFTYAKELAGRLGVEVILLNVYSPDESELIPMRRAYVEHAAEIIRHQKKKVQLGEGAVVARGELAMGNPAEEILRYADENGIDFILMATHGRSGINRWAMGSVAYRVLRASKVPVWLVRAGIPKKIIHDKLPVRKILVPLDGSKLAELVLPHVEALAKQGDVELVDVVLLRVCDPLILSSDYPYDNASLLSWDEHVEQETVKWKLVAGSYLTEVEKRLKAAGLKVRSEVLMGKAIDEIVDYANRNHFSLTVMVIYSRSGISRWVYGSVTEKVLLGVSTPVLIVRPQ